MSLIFRILKAFMIASQKFSFQKGEYDVLKERRKYERLAGNFKALTTYQVTELDGEIKGDWIELPNAVKERVVLYFHGGSYNVGSAKMIRPLAVNTGYMSKSNVLSLEYGLAPENPYPIALEEGVKAYSWLLERYKEEDIIFAGDSAGGGLLLCLLLKLKELQISLPTAAICYSPWTDLGLTGKSYMENRKADVATDFDSLEYSVKIYKGKENSKHPMISPLYGNLEGLPNILIQVGSDEILLSDSVSFAEKVEKIGGRVKLEIWQNMQHEWQFAANILPEGKKALQSVGRFIESHFGERDNWCEENPKTRDV